MAGILSSVMLAGLLAAGPDVFTFDGPEVTARTVGNVGFFTQGAVPFTDLFERGQGSAELFAQDRIADPRATYGDAGRLEATFQIGGNTYRVELGQVGFPPAQAMVSAPVAGPLPPPPAQAISGGVMVNQELHGATGLGFSSMPRVQAAAAVWGVGRVWRNGALLTDTALIHAAALSRGAHADDDTFRLLAVARPGDTELYVMVWNLPPEAEPRGFIQFGFDDVAINLDGSSVPAVAFVPTAGVPDGLEPPSTPVPGGSSLGAIPNSALSQQQGAGGSGQAGTGQAGTGGFAVAQPGTGQVGLDGLSDPARTQAAEQADVTFPGPARAAASDVLNPFLGPGRVSPSIQQPGQPDVQTPGFQPTPAVPPAFFNPEEPGRVALSAGEPGTPGQPDAQLPGRQQTPFIPEGFQDPARQVTAAELPPPTLGGFVPLTAQPQSSFLSTSGSFSVVPLVPGVAGPGFAFGGPRVTAGLVRTPEPQQVQTPAVPLVATPQPLNAQPPVPLVSGALPLNAQPAVPLIRSPQPLNAQPIGGTPAAVSGIAPTTAGPVPGAVTTPGLVPGTTVGPGGAPGTTTPGVSSPGGGGAAPAP